VGVGRSPWWWPALRRTTHNDSHNDPR
jgi:hypothetical protein